jgi:hypothetical protein
MSEWQPIETAPRSGKFIVASRAPTNWAYRVNTVVLHAEDGERLREFRLKYATHWMPMLPDPYSPAETTETA